MVTRNQRVIDQLLRSPNGPVGRDLSRRGIRVANRSKAILTATKAVDVGRLRSAQAPTDVVPTSRGLGLQVGSNVVYSLPIHEGGNSKYAPPSWRIAASRGHVVPARKFLTRALDAARS
jgi:hypothetical protein